MAPLGVNLPACQGAAVAQRARARKSYRSARTLVLGLSLGQLAVPKLGPLLAAPKGSS